MTVAALLLGLVAFIIVLRVLKAQDVATRILSTAQQSILVIADSDIGDDEKEKRIRQASVQLFGSFLAILGISIASLSASGVIVWGGAAAGLYLLDDALRIAIGWPFIIGCSIAAVALWLALDRIGKKPAQSAETQSSEEVPYSPLDKALHTYAFKSPARQRGLGNLESRLYKRRINLDHAARPVFVTSLPRAGTTIMLNTLSQMPEFASATYRHMPFTLSPLLWGGFSGTFRKAGDMTERAHGDGIEVGVDSPEAFEEMLWMAFWAEKYEAQRILPWSAEDQNAEFETFFRTHMAKIVATKSGAQRYISKNNANIARLGYLSKVFPDASIVIPVRNPAAQVASLMRQHTRFTDLHAREPFARQYMEGIGHFEFGGALRPIDFNGAALDPAQAEGPDFWLRNWIGAYEFVLANAGDSAIFVDHDALCADPQSHLPLLAEAIDCATADELLGLSGTFRSPPAAPVLDGASAALVSRANELHHQMCELSLVPIAPHSRLEASA